MQKDKIIMISTKDFVVLKGENVKDVVTAQLCNNILNFISYEHESVEEIAFRKGYSVSNNKTIRIVEFEDEIYLRAKSDKEAIAPICIEECDNKLHIVDLRQTDCTSIVEDMQGDISQVSQNFDIVEGRPFLMEDEFSL